MLRVLPELYPERPSERGVHPTAIIGRGARVGADVAIGAYAVIGDDAQLGDDVVIASHVSVGAGVTVGAQSWLADGVTLYPGTALGERVRVHAGARIGSDGFGYVHARRAAHEDSACRPLHHRGRRRDRREHDDRSRQHRRHGDRRRHEDRQPRADRAQRADRTAVPDHGAGRHRRLGAHRGRRASSPARWACAGITRSAPARASRRRRAYLAIFRPAKRGRDIRRVRTRRRCARRRRCSSFRVCCGASSKLAGRSATRERRSVIRSREPVALEGIGLHLGAACRLTFRPGAERGGDRVPPRRSAGRARDSGARRACGAARERRTQLGKEPKRCTRWSTCSPRSRRSRSTIS